MALRRKGNDRLGVVSTEGPTVKETFSKAFQAEANWPDKDEFLDVIYWMRQILGVVIGLIWGVVPLKGIVALILFLAVNCLVVYIYYSTFQRVDDEEVGGPGEIFKEGLGTSFATFCVTWIICYSALHHDYSL